LRAKEKSGKILLNITGGGYKRLKADEERIEIKSSGQLALDVVETELSEFEHKSSRAISDSVA
jgi:hypothetical protein